MIEKLTDKAMDAVIALSLALPMILEVLAYCLVSFGLGLIYFPLSFIAAGVSVWFIAAALERSK